MKLTNTFALAMLLGATASHAQTVPDRTIEEIKVEAQSRAERGAYPLIGLDPADVREALANIKTPDRDEWAAAWSEVAQRYYKAAEASQSPQEKKEEFPSSLATLLLRAMAGCRIGRKESGLFKSVGCFPAR